MKSTVSGAWGVLRKLFSSHSLLASDLESFRRQESIFISLNLFFLVGLFLLHLYFAAYWGQPPRLLVLTVWFGVFAKLAEWLWLRRLSRPPGPFAVSVLTWSSIALNVAVTSLLAILTDKDDNPYFVLMVVAVLEAAFRFRLLGILSVVAVVDLSLFVQVWWYFNAHPPLDVGEYYEASITSVLFLIVGILVWLLLADLRRKEERLANNVLELESTREKLLREERLSAVGRLSSAIAHEIRNPVAMIASSIATAKTLSGAEREEMFAIASQEANRLTKLTTEFLEYASTRPPKLEPVFISDLVAYVADASRAHASNKGVHFDLELPKGLCVHGDEGQLQQALMNLLLNAVDASPNEGHVLIRVHDGDQRLHLDVENGGSAIPEPALGRIFEPFFTTKPHGTGLGLAIARNILRAQGGDLVLAINEPHRVRFSLMLPVSNEPNKN